MVKIASTKGSINIIFVRLHATIHQSYDANKNIISAFRKIDGYPITIAKITDETLTHVNHSLLLINITVFKINSYVFTLENRNFNFENFQNSDIFLLSF